MRVRRGKDEEVFAGELPVVRVEFVFCKSKELISVFSVYHDDLLRRFPSVGVGGVCVQIAFIPVPFCVKSCFSHD